MGEYMSRISADQKETAIETIRLHGTMKSGAEAAGVSVRTLNEEMRRSAIFRRRLLEAREEGNRNIADNAIERIKEYAFSPPAKTDRNVLTAAIALANAYEPGFRGSTIIQGKIAHDVRVLSAVPRPKYDELPKPKITIDRPPEEMLKLGEEIKNTKTKREIEIRDERGYIGTQTIEEAKRIAE